MEKTKKHSDIPDKPEEEVLSIFCFDFLLVESVVVIDFRVVQVIWTNTASLSDTAKKDLILVLQKDIGMDRAKEFSDADLNKIGWLLLTILAENLKLRVARPDLFEVK